MFPIKFALELGREELYKLKNLPFYRCFNFPVDISVEIELIENSPMKVIGLDGRDYPFSLKEAQVSDENRSSGHLKARTIIAHLFPYDNFFEEISLPGSYGLTADFISILRKVIFEIHGSQHYDFSPFFHKTLGDFQKHKQRDLNKIKWAKLNGFYLVELDTRDKNEWESRIRNFWEYSATENTG